MFKHAQQRLIPIDSIELSLKGPSPLDIMRSNLELDIPLRGQETRSKGSHVLISLCDSPRFALRRNKRIARRVIGCLI